MQYCLQLCVYIAHVCFWDLFCARYGCFCICCCVNCLKCAWSFWGSWHCCSLVDGDSAHCRSTFSYCTFFVLLLTIIAWSPTSWGCFVCWGVLMPCFGVVRGVKRLDHCLYFASQNIASDGHHGCRLPESKRSEQFVSMMDHFRCQFFYSCWKSCIFFHPRQWTWSPLC